MFFVIVIALTKRSSHLPMEAGHYLLIVLKVFVCKPSCVVEEAEIAHAKGPTTVGPSDIASFKQYEVRGSPTPC